MFSVRSISAVLLGVLCLQAVLCSSTSSSPQHTLERLIAHGQFLPSESDLLEIAMSYGYVPDATSARFQLFKERLESIIIHNLDENKTFTREINKFTFMTFEEFAAFTGGEQNCSATSPRTEQSEKITVDELQNKFSIPEFVDWRIRGVVSPVKNQGKCGSCWTFSATGAIESHLSIQTGKAPINVSEQQLVDCAGDFDNQGCNGGLPSHAFEYLRYAGGIETGEDYPYLAVDGTCHFDKKLIAARVTGSYNVTFQDEAELIQKLATVGPISIAFQVTKDFSSYSSGVYNNPTCSTLPQEVNHAVLAVGYSLSERYYIVKNSWGENWGEHGYFRIRMGANMCGLADCASYPLMGNNKAPT